MLSSPTYDAIARLTEEALKEIGDWGNVRDRVTIARRYVELLAGDPTRKDHGYGLSAALLDLSYIAIRQKKPALAADLQKLVIAIDAERLA